MAIFGSVSVEDTQKRLSKKFGARDAAEAARIKANALLRGDKSDIQPRAKAPVQTKRKKPRKVIKVDPNVKPVGAPVLPVATIAQGLKNAFSAGKAKIKQAGVDANAKIKGRTIVPGQDSSLPGKRGLTLPQIVKLKSNAKKARKVNLGGTRSDRSRDTDRSRSR